MIRLDDMPRRPSIVLATLVILACHSTRPGASPGAGTRPVTPGDRAPANLLVPDTGSGSTRGATETGNGTLVERDTTAIPFRGLLSDVDPTLLPGEFVGVVIDAETRLPVEAASIVAPALRRAASTASDGRFRLRITPGEDVRLTIRRIGYEIRHHTVRTPGNGGRVALITLAQDRRTFCDLVYTGVRGGELPQPAPAVRLHVRTVRAMKPDEAEPLVIRVFTRWAVDDPPQLVDSTVITRDASAGITLDLAADKGDNRHYEVVIRSRSTREWRGGGHRPCGAGTPLQLEAWLFPR